MEEPELMGSNHWAVISCGGETSAVGADRVFTVAIAWYIHGD